MHTAMNQSRFGSLWLWAGVLPRLVRSDQVLLLIKNLALRQQLLFFKRQHRRPRLAGMDKLFWVLLCRSLDFLETDPDCGFTRVLHSVPDAVVSENLRKWLFAISLGFSVTISVRKSRFLAPGCRTARA